MNTGPGRPSPAQDPVAPGGAGTATPPAEGRGAAGASTGPASAGAVASPEGRGHTGITDRVLERVAACAVREVEQVGGAAPRMLGVPLGRDAGRANPRVSGHVEGRMAIVRVTLSVAYPAPIRQVVHRVREHVVSRVRELTGLEARQVDIDVTRLIHPDEPGRRVR
ncbi:Asp23/Gls24 family envelope stress response protein [Sphaerisporangium sp. NPDC005288]|uniref:Asp23/Gls24 family envelope stress response protein n=1 Tax=Sphaerisporangium sp. NPDC005288 TaxID=3155114 RepID=UPI0033A22E36